MAESQPNNGGMKHEVQLVAGSGTAEGYSREGSDVDGRLSHVEDPSRGAKDAAQALLGGLAVSSAIKSNGHHHHHHDDGVAGMGDGFQKMRDGGGGGVRDAPNTPGSNRKGHDEEQTLLSGVGNLMKRARRRFNSYFSAAARHQKKFAREKRERHRKQSSNFDFLVDAEEGVHFLSADGGAGGVENGTETNGGPLHRSQSDLFVPSRSAEEQEDALGPAMVSETRSSGMAADPGELRDVGETTAFLQGVEGVLTGESTMKRNRLTTGDLVRLYREEEQGAGEDSAQDEDRERAGASKRGSFRWSLRPSRATSTLQLNDRKQKVEQWKRDREQWADQGFKVLGAEIGHLPESQQVALLAGGVFFFLLIYGYMQEYLVVKIFEREFGLFMTFLQFFGYAACAALRRGVHRESGRKIPLRTYFGLGFLQAVMQGLTNVSMMYLNYPAKVLFKSSRMVPIMCFGVVWQGRRYSLKDCGIVCLIVVGLATFMNAEARSSAVSETPTSLLGVACISLALVIDAANINIQEEVMNRYASCQDELIMFSYLCGTVYVASFCVFSGELVPGIVFLHSKGFWAIGAVMLYCGSGFLGGSCAVALTKRFGALHSAITTTARKAVTLMLSFAYFQKAFTPQHLVGASVFMVGLMAKIFGKGSNSKGAARSSEPSSPTVTPFVEYRKHLGDNRDDDDQLSSRSSPLLPGGTGGGSCNGGGGGGGHMVSNGSIRTQSPSPVSQEGPTPATLTDHSNSGGFPVRHRGMPKMGGGADGSGSEKDGGGERGATCDWGESEKGRL
eukprot:g7170.t1